MPDLFEELGRGGGAEVEHGVAPVLARQDADLELVRVLDVLDDHETEGTEDR